MAQGRAHDREKVARVLADLYLNAGSRDEIAEKHEVAAGTVTNIKKRYFDDFDRLKKRSPEFADISALTTGLLEQSLVTLTIQLEHFGNTEWLETQPAGELANLHGVINDKTVRLLAAAQNAQRERIAEADIPRFENSNEGQAADSILAERGARDVS